MRKIGKIFISVIILVSAFLFINISYHNYTNYNRQINEQIKFVEFILTGASWLKPEHFMQENKKSKEFIEWIESQTNPIYINNDLHKYYVEYDSLKNYGYIYLSSDKKGLKHTRFNNLDSEGLYSIKENYFLEYLFTRKYCVVISSLRNNEIKNGK